MAIKVKNIIIVIWAIFCILFIAYVVYDVTHMDPSGNKIKWKNKVIEENKEKLWYQKGMEGGKLKKLRIGWERRFSIKYSKIKKSKKDKCDAYVDNIDKCNICVSNMQMNILNLSIRVTAIVIASILKVPSAVITFAFISDAVSDAGGVCENLWTIQKNSRKWKEQYKYAQSNFKKIREYGTEY